MVRLRQRLGPGLTNSKRLRSPGAGENVVQVIICEVQAGGKT